MRTKEENKIYMKEYNNRPGNKEKRKKYLKEYNQRPEVKEMQKKHRKEYSKLDYVKERKKQYAQRPDIKERIRKYHREYQKKYGNTPKEKERKRAYSQSERGKIKKKEYLKKPEVIKRRKILNKEYNKRGYVKAKKKKYVQRPEIKEMICKYHKEYHKEYSKRPGYSEKVRKNAVRLRKENTGARIKHTLRNRLLTAINLYTEIGKIKSSCEYGIDYEAIIEQLKPFPKDRHLYHIDHIIPLASFNLEDPEEVRKAFAPRNHQWLLIEVNLKKGKKITSQSKLGLFAA